MAADPGKVASAATIAEPHDSDVDAEADDDYEDLPQPAPTSNGVLHGNDEESTELDLRPEQNTLIAQPAKRSNLLARRNTENRGSRIQSQLSDEEHGGVESHNDTESMSEGEDWKAVESDAIESIEAEAIDSAVCMFCGQDEEHDPSADFEECLACHICGNHAHRQCAREANAVDSNDDAAAWRCSTCIANNVQLEPGSVEKQLYIGRRRSSVPKFTRDLLPAQRGAIRPDSHSMFNKLILDDDPMDGSRSLRKRKSSEEAERSGRKRRRVSRPGIKARHSRRATHSSTPDPLTHEHTDMLPAAEGMEDSEEGEEVSRPQRRRARPANRPLVTPVPGAGVLVLSFNLDRQKVQAILSRKPRKNRGRGDRRKKILAVPQIVSEPEPSHYPAIQNVYTGQNLFGNDRDEENKKPYGGILSEADADTTKTFPNEEDRTRFERARLKAEEAWKAKLAALATESDLKRAPPKGAVQPVKIQCINFGGFEIDTWHTAPYPEEYSRNRVLYVCEFCLKYMNSDYVAWRHKLKCPAKHPPGDEIYREGKYSFFEVDGRKNPLYCQNLCLLAKLFLGSKTLYYDVEPFLFYVMTENDDYGHRFVGYFSKEKRPSSLNNVSCILTLPIHQRKGFGHMLIDFSYLLTKVEQKTGSPEKPLSDMGLVTYRGYWRLVLCKELLGLKEPISISELSDRTGITADDLVSTLEGMRALVRDPVTKTYALRLDHEFMREYVAKYEQKSHPKINPDCLIWEPYVMGRKEEAPAMATVAQRDDDEEDVGEMPEEGIQLEQMEGQTSMPSMEAVDSGDGNATPLAVEPRSQDSPVRTGLSTPHTNGNINGGSFTIQNGEASNAPIPPSRFEIYPPMKRPPPSIRRRSGRPFGSRRRTITPLRRTRTLTNGAGDHHLDTPTAAGPSISRVRSRLGEVINGTDPLDGQDDTILEAHAQDEIDGISRARGSHADHNGISRTNGNHGSGDDHDEEGDEAEDEEESGDEDDRSESENGGGDAEADAEYEDIEDAEDAEDDDDDAVDGHADGEADEDFDEDGLADANADSEPDADADADSDVDGDADGDADADADEDMEDV